ncbi:hypothetical protein B4915_06610 [Leucobacter massiliensis]|uniref:Uncharacterized protein n=1 Tax=Leucobacter massiliensis TaxID=1686285 RepID=A0A2S9QPI5_9MICO|nr:hypothetical protein B4915_06610 [Leucobacter massiliensis]
MRDRAQRTSERERERPGTGSGARRAGAAGASPLPALRAGLSGRAEFDAVGAEELGEGGAAFGVPCGVAAQEAALFAEPDPQAALFGVTA